MQLSEADKGNLIRLFSDEGLIGVVTAIAKDAMEEYRERAYQAAYGANPNLVEITQYACKAAGFEAIVPLLEKEFEKITHEEEDGREG